MVGQLDGQKPSTPDVKDISSKKRGKVPNDPAKQAKRDGAYNL
jgi:hypothetical protein